VTSRRRNWLRRRYFATLHTHWKNHCHRIIDLHLVVYQWYFCDTFEASGSSRPNGCNIDEVRAARRKTRFFRQFDSFFISLKSFFLTYARAIVWLLVERADNVNFDLARFTASSPAINDATSTSSSKSSQSIFCAHHMLAIFSCLHVSYSLGREILFNVITLFYCMPYVLCTFCIKLYIRYYVLGINIFVVQLYIFRFSDYH